MIFECLIGIACVALGTTYTVDPAGCFINLGKLCLHHTIHGFSLVSSLDYAQCLVAVVQSGSNAAEITCVDSAHFAVTRSQCDQICRVVVRLWISDLLADAQRLAETIERTADVTEIRTLWITLDPPNSFIRIC